jgi:hypothetical protein
MHTHRHPLRRERDPSVLPRPSELAVRRFRGRRPGERPAVSLVQCAKANPLEPYAYLRRVFTELPKAQSLGDIEALLPIRLSPADLI